MKGPSSTLSAGKPCTYTSWLMLHGTHNYSREVEGMPLYRDFNYSAPLKDIACTPLTCRVTVPLLQQYSWIYSAKTHTTCVRPYDPWRFNKTNDPDLSILMDPNATNGTRANPFFKPYEFLLELSD